VFTEAEISKRLNAGRTPVREALLLLEKEGLIKIRHNVGFMIRQFGAKEIDEYRIIRAFIEKHALSLAIPNMTDTHLDQLHENLKNLQRSIQQNNFLESVRYETEFHEIIYDAAESEVVHETLEGLNNKFLWIRAAAMSNRSAPDQCLEQHQRILNEIENKDISKAKKYMHQHLNSGWKKLTKSFVIHA
jgi:DNA-binding GntR family transcriptional regulator